MADELPWEPDLLSRIHQPTPQQVTATRDPVPFIWESRIPAEKVSIFSGAGGSGKSSLLVGLVLARACGRRFLGKLTRPGATLVVSAEDAVIDYMRKVDAWREVYRDLDPVAIARNLQILPLVGEDFRLVGGRYGGCYVERERVDRLSVAARAMNPRPDLIILETASRFGVGDENSNESAAALIAACERLSSNAQAAVTLVAHVGKAAAREQTVDAYSARGASAFTDNARSALVLGTISPDRAKRLALTADEARDLLIVACPKANLAGRSADIVVERVETVHGLVLRPFEGGGMTMEDRVTAGRVAAMAKREERGRLLRALVLDLTQAGTVVTPRLLRDEQRVALRNIPVREIPEVVEQAVADGWLAVGDIAKKGGGKILLPGSGKRDQVGSSGIALPLEVGSHYKNAESQGNGEVGSSGVRRQSDPHSQVGSQSLSLKETTSDVTTSFPSEINALGQNGVRSGNTGSVTTSTVASNGLFPNIPPGGNGVPKIPPNNSPVAPENKSPNIPAANVPPWA